MPAGYSGLIWEEPATQKVLETALLPGQGEEHTGKQWVRVIHGPITHPPVFSQVGERRQASSLLNGTDRVKSQQTYLVPRTVSLCMKIYCLSMTSTRY